MSSNRTDSNSCEVRVELKYCEHCGGLWVRERGAGVVYCEKCQGKVDDLPIRRKRPGRVRLPVGEQVERKYSVAFEEETPDLDAVGGVA
jgi:ribosomal protein L37AE/L43A